MDIDINKAKDAAQDALDKVTKDEKSKKAANDVIETVEKKINGDRPDVDTSAGALGKK